MWMFLSNAIALQNGDIIIIIDINWDDISCIKLYVSTIYLYKHLT